MANVIDQVINIWQNKDKTIRDLPKTVTKAVYDAKTGKRLDNILKETDETLSGLEIHRKTLSTGATQVVFDNLEITSDSVIEFYASVYGISPTEVLVNVDSITTTWEAQTSNIEVGVAVRR